MDVGQKAGSPFTGDQIKRYLLAIAEAKDETKRRLVVLGSESDRDLHDGGHAVKTVTWTELARIAERPEVSPLWRDFALFLRERGLVRSSHTAAPAEALPVEWLADAIAGAVERPVVWSRWPRGRDFHTTRASVLTHLNKQVRQVAAPWVDIWAPGQFTRIDLGAADDAGSLSVRIAVGVRTGIPHGVVHRLARMSHLPSAGWRLGLAREDAVILTITKPFKADTAPSEGASWLRAQLTALDAAGVLVDVDGDGALRAVDGGRSKPPGG